MDFIFFGMYFSCIGNSSSYSTKKRIFFLAECIKVDRFVTEKMVLSLRNFTLKMMIFDDKKYFF